MPARLRSVPPQFSWIDQRLVRGGFLARCDAPAAALYLFLITVADARGLSYYGEAAVTRHLNLTPTQLSSARDRLIGADLIAFEAPLYQVLALTAVTPTRSAMPTPTPTIPTTAAAAVDRIAAGAQLQRLCDQLRSRRG